MSTRAGSPASAMTILRNASVIAFCSPEPPEVIPPLIKWHAGGIGLHPHHDNSEHSCLGATASGRPLRR